MSHTAVGPVVLVTHHYGVKNRGSTRLDIWPLNPYGACAPTTSSCGAASSTISIGATGAWPDLEACASSVTRLRPWI